MNCFTIIFTIPRLDIQILYLNPFFRCFSMANAILGGRKLYFTYSRSFGFFDLTQEGKKEVVFYPEEIFW